jgi:N-hydroxyarylamine O-acetyltransferase
MDSEQIDLAAYFRRIGYEGAASPDLSTLQAIVAHHVQTIPFEGLDPFLHRPVLLDLPSLEAKLVRAGRGGYCFEQNRLLSQALRQLGYRVRNLASRVVWHDRDDAPAARSHMLLHVDLEEGPYIADVGFGVMAPTSPLRLEPNAEQPTLHERFRFKPFGQELLSQAEVAGEWKSLYRFELTQQLLADYEVANWWTSTHPESPFVRSLVAARPDKGRRYTLINTEFTEYPMDGPKTARTLTGPSEIREVLTDVFRITVPDVPDLGHRLERLWSP